jgi:hypothetical protein
MRSEITIHPKNDSLTTEFTEIINRIKVHGVILSHLFGYISVNSVVFLG